MLKEEEEEEEEQSPESASESATASDSIRTLAICTGRISEEMPMCAVKLCHGITSAHARRYSCCKHHRATGGTHELLAGSSDCSRSTIYQLNHQLIPTYCNIHCLKASSIYIHSAVGNAINHCCLYLLVLCKFIC